MRKIKVGKLTKQFDSFSIVSMSGSFFTRKVAEKNSSAFTVCNTSYPSSIAFPPRHTLKFGCGRSPFNAQALLSIVLVSEIISDSQIAPSAIQSVMVPMINFGKSCDGKFKNETMKINGLSSFRTKSVPLSIDSASTVSYAFSCRPWPSGYNPLEISIVNKGNITFGERNFLHSFIVLQGVN